MKKFRVYNSETVRCHTYKYIKKFKYRTNDGNNLGIICE